MINKEKVINGWECHMESDTLRCADCPYRDGWRTCNYADTLYKDVYDLLKEQEAVTIKKTKEHGFGVYGGICPKCRNWIQSAHSFCGFCGQAVKWE